jgi:hypothetical protein
MITRGFKPVGWVAAVGAAALGCYMLSLRVASERADLTSLEQRIVQTRQQIRALQTELGTRGRLQQLEQWNDEVLALAAPVSGQFIASDTQLASFSAGPAATLDGAAVQMASAAPAPAAPAAPAAPTPSAHAVPAPQHAVASPQRAIAPPPVLEQPLVQRASLDTIPQQAAPAPARPRVAPLRPQPAPPRARTIEAGPARATRTASAEPQAASARRPSLLDARTLRDIGSAARAERRGGTGD